MKIRHIIYLFTAIVLAACTADDDDLLTEQKMKGVAVVYVGEDLDVLLELADRIMVICGGQVSGIVDTAKTTKEEVGLLMTKFRKEGNS